MSGLQPVNRFTVDPHGRCILHPTSLKHSASVTIKVLRRLVVILSVLFLYLAFTTRTYYWDGVLFSLYIEGVQRGELPRSILFHPNHLIYSAFGYLLYTCALKLGLAVRAIAVLQILNALLSAATGYIFFLLAKRITNSFPNALFCWLLFAFGATWWKFSTDADAYIISVLLLILAVAFVIERPMRLIPAALCHVAAMLFHELAVFSYAPVVLAIALETNWSRLKRFWIAAAYCASTATVVAGAYLTCYSQTNRTTYPTLLSWITSYAADSGFTHSFAQLIVANLSSLLKLLFGGKGSMIHDYFSFVMLLSFSVCAAALAWAIVLFRQVSIVLVTRDSRTAFILWAWLLPCAAFLAAWDPGSNFHKLFIWPAIVLLLGCFLKRSQWAWVAVTIALAAWNFGAFIYPHSHADADPVLALAQTIDRQLPKDATIYYSVLSPDDWYLEYFAPGRTWTKLAGPDTIKKKRGLVCLETTALEQLKNEGTNPSPALKWDLLNSRHHIRFECLR